MEPYGKGRRKVLIIGEAPGKGENEEGKQFVGKAGKHLWDTLKKLGVSRDDCWTDNAIRCWPHEGERNRTPTPKEVEFCNPPEAPIWMADFSFKSLGEIEIGDEIIGWTREKITEENRSRAKFRRKKLVGKTAKKGRKTARKKLVVSEVLAIHRRMSPIVKVELESGRIIRCSPDHLWLHGDASFATKLGGERFHTVMEKRSLASVVTPIDNDPPEELRYWAGYLGAMMDGEGHWPRIGQSWSHNEVVCKRIERAATKLGFRWAWNHGKKCSTLGLMGEINAEVKFLNWCRPAKKKNIKKRIMNRSSFCSVDRIKKVTPDGEGEVIGLTTTSGNYIAWGYASKNCRPNLERTIREKQPDVILLLGAIPISSFLSTRFPSPMSNGGMGRWTGWKIPCRNPNTWVCPTWHPSYLLREKNDVMQREWERHLKAAFELEGKPWQEIPNERGEVRCIFDPDEAAREIADLWGGEFSPDVPIAFDYESNMLKPDSNEARIVCCSMSNGNKTITYPWHGKAKEATGKFLQSRIPKVTYNAKFEVRWTLKEFGHGVRNVAWDGMLAAHAIDNRSGVTGCDFQAFVNLGMPDYWSRVGPYLKAKRKGGNEPNRVGEVDLESLLLYCGTDSLIEWKLAEVQKRIMGAKKHDANLFVRHQ